MTLFGLTPSESGPLLAIVALVLVVLAAVAFALKGKGSGLGVAPDVYYLRKTLFTPAERSYLGVLDSVLPADVRVFGKVRLEDFLGVKSGLDRGARMGARNRINRKHVDFLLVRSSDLAPLAGIELDDKGPAVGGPSRRGSGRTLSHFPTGQPANVTLFGLTPSQSATPTLNLLTPALPHLVPIHEPPPTIPGKPRGRLFPFRARLLAGDAADRGARLSRGAIPGSDPEGVMPLHVTFRTEHPDL